MAEPVPVQPEHDAATGDGLAYHRLHQRGRNAWWRSLTGVIALIAIMLALVPLFWQLPFAAWFALTGQPVVAGMTRLLDLNDPTPAGLAYLNLVLASAIPVTWGLTRVLHGLRPRWLASVAPRIRWRWLLTCLALAMGALLVTLLVSAVVPSGGEAAELSGDVNDFTRRTRDFLLVVVLLTPLQAAGEEYAFRGYLTQAFGGLFRHPLPAVVAPALLFALAHGAQSAPVFFDRFAFGVVAGILVIVTGGLEAGIAMHVLNNWLAFGLALTYGDMASTLNATGGSWWSIPVTLTQSLVYLAVVLFTARRQGLGTRSEGGVLAGPSPRV